MTTDAAFLADAIATCTNCRRDYPCSRLHCVRVDGIDGDWCWPCVEAKRLELLEDAR